MSNCDDFADWDNKTIGERADALEVLINDSLAEEGYDPVNVEIDDLGGDTRAETPDGNTVVFNADDLANGNADESVNDAFHEAEHARQWQDGDLDWYADGDGSLDGDPLAQQDDAYAAGDAGQAEWEDECDPDPESSSDDGAGGGGGDLDLELVPIPPDGVEIDWDHLGEGWTP